MSDRSEAAAGAEGFRCGRVALLGPPNVGKSTLLNRIIGARIAIVTPKPQTTRHRILGIYTDHACQIVFIDTPGIHRARSRLNRAMVQTAMAAIEEADLLLLLHDVTRRTEGGMERWIEPLVARHPELPRLHLLNKIDRIPTLELLPRIEALHRMDEAARGFIPVSARKGTQIDELLRTITALLPERPPLYDPEWFTDQSARTLAAEYVREQLFLALQQEVPFQTAVLVEAWREQGPRVEIEAVILVGSKSHKPMVVGKGGRRIKQIGSRARAGIAHLLQRNVDLRLFVKVQPDWFEQPEMLRTLGIEQ
ncbi:MAG: GTPase Era [Zetaproteobacteria bacterium]|nr:MAG: GTPase Era [Zetaproteobacteria bacterium]